MLILRDDITVPAPLAHYTAATTTPERAGVEVWYPPSPSSLWPSAQVEHLDLRGPYHTGLRLVNCWNATLADCFIHGLLTEAENQRPQAMTYGLDLGNAMDAHVVRPRITAATIGIYAGAPASDGRAEGLHIEGGWLMHVSTGIHLAGEIGGGWPTPAHWIARLHINHLQYGLFAHLCSGLHLLDNDLYASHYTTGQWGIYLVGCRNVEIRGNHFWANRDGFYGGIVLDACAHVSISGGIVDDSVSIALHATPSCVNVTTEGATWNRAARAGKIVNRSRPS